MLLLKLVTILDLMEISAKQPPQDRLKEPPLDRSK